MKNISLKALLPKRETLSVLLATFLLTLGTYFAYPVRGIVAAFPLCFLFSALAFFVTGRIGLNCAISLAVAFFYAFMTSFYDPFLFAVFILLDTLAGSFFVRALMLIRDGKKTMSALLFFSMLLVGILLPLLICGTPAAYLSAKEEARDYLARTYPDQRFSDLDIHYNVKERGYETFVSYEYEGNLLTSHLFFGEEIEDGFLEDYSGWMQEKRKSQLISLFDEGEKDLLVSAAGLAGRTEDSVYRGSYGSLHEEMEPLFRFSATFREEKPDRREFAEACADVFAFLEEKDFTYGAITFYALDAGNVIYECTVTPDTDPETILSLVTYAK